MALETVVEQLTDSTKSLLSAINTGVNTVGANLQDKITQAEGYAQQALTQKVAAQEAATQATGSSTLVLEVYQDIQANWQTKLDAADSAAATATSAASTATTKAGEAAVSAQEVLAAQTDIATNWQDKLDAADAAATTATTQAGIATNQAGIATAAASGIEAHVASAESAAAAALLSQQSAASSVLTASTKAAQALEAANSASLSSVTATDQAVVATVKAAIATSKAEIATTKASEAAASAALAASVNSNGGFFNNVTAMQAANLTVGSIVRTSGYTTPGDGGGATYEIVSGSTVLGYDEPNIQAYNFIPSTYLKAPFTGNWIRQNVAALGSGSLSGALTAPDGTLTADFIAETITTGQHYVQLNQIMGAGGSVPLFPVAPTEFICYVAKYDAADPKRRSHFYCGFCLGSNYNLAANYATSIIDLTSGAVTSSTYGSNFLSAKTVVVDAGSYWLVKIQVTPTAVGQCVFLMGPSNSPSSSSYAGSDPTVQPKGVYVWGWSIRPIVTPGVLLNNALQAKPLLGNTVRISQFAAASGADNNAVLRALSYFGTNPGTLIIDAPTVFTQPASLSTLTIPSNVTLRFEGAGALTGVTNLTVNSQLIADNRAILPKVLTATLGPCQRSVLSNWFGL